MLRHSFRPCLRNAFSSRRSSPLPLCSVPVQLPTAWCRQFKILAIETSCDDTCVAVLELQPSDTKFRKTRLLFNERITSDNVRYGGVHPLRSMESHHEKLASLVRKAVLRTNMQKPDLIAVTKGPGMRNNLQCGIDVAKGLSVAWDVPLLGVHHMQAHALAPRLHSSLSASHNPDHPKHDLQPEFPFLSLLVSGGHTLLVHSHSLTDHRILASTTDIAIGDCLDKAARLILPQDIIDASQTVAYGSLLEAFAFDQTIDPNNRKTAKYNYSAPATTREEFDKAFQRNKWGWSFPTPLMTKDGKKSKSMEYTFSGIYSHVHRIVYYGATHRIPRAVPMDRREARDLAMAAMQSAFEHLASRVCIFLDASRSTRQMDTSTGAAAGQEAAEQFVDNHSNNNNNSSSGSGVITDLVLGGGVASNAYLRNILQKYLSARGFPTVRLRVVDPRFCVDNAAMIAWTAAEMVGVATAGVGFTLQKDEFGRNLEMRSLRKWSLENLGAPEKEEERERAEEVVRDGRGKSGDDAMHIIESEELKIDEGQKSKDHTMHVIGSKEAKDDRTDVNSNDSLRTDELNVSRLEVDAANSNSNHAVHVDELHVPRLEDAAADAGSKFIPETTIPASSADLEKLLASFQANPTNMPVNALSRKR